MEQLRLRTCKLISCLKLGVQNKWCYYFLECIVGISSYQQQNNKWQSKSPLFETMCQLKTKIFNRLPKNAEMVSRIMIIYDKNIWFDECFQWPTFQFKYIRFSPSKPRLQSFKRHYSNDLYFDLIELTRRCFSRNRIECRTGCPTMCLPFIDSTQNEIFAYYIKQRMHLPWFRKRIAKLLRIFDSIQ